jgi:hypothetical protein
MSSKQDPERDPDAQDTDCEGRNKDREENSASTPIILAKNVTIGTITEAKSGARDDLGSSTQKIGDHGDRPYMYRDFSQIPEEEFDMDYEVDQEGLLQVSLSYFSVDRNRLIRSPEIIRTFCPFCRLWKNPRLWLQLKPCSRRPHSLLSCFLIRLEILCEHLAGFGRSVSRSSCMPC